MLERGLTRREEGIMAPGTPGKDSILVHRMGFDDVLFTDRRTADGIVVVSICGKCEYAVWVRFDEPLFVAWVPREEQRCSIRRFSNTSGARRQDYCCGISPEGELMRKSQFECYAIDYYWMVGEWMFKAGQPVNVG